ncbi:MAG: FHA domain-containing protein [Phycisphaerales bacterium]|nr:MAG: FHA domain-containing protein [Phycisphaerales bacterium]
MANGFRITITAGTGLVGSTVPLKPDAATTIGTRSTCSLVTPSERVAPVHCKIAREGGDWVLRCETDSRTQRLCGVNVNDGRCTEFRLRHGDRIEIGCYRLRFDEPDGPPDPFEALAPPITLAAVPPPQQGNPRITALAGERVLIGSSDTALWRLPDRTVSRHHCRVEFDGQNWIIRDLQSRNGTYVDGQRVASTDLSHGSRIRVGRYRIEVAIEG